MDKINNEYKEEKEKIIKKIGNIEVEIEQLKNEISDREKNLEILNIELLNLIKINRKL